MSEPDEITASDLLHLPHIVILEEDNGRTRIIDFDNGEDAHKFAENQTIGSIPTITVCARIRTLSRL